MPRELKPEDVIKALEHCADYKRAEVSCVGCPIYGRCFYEENLLERAALALLREKDAEIERLTVNMNAYGLTAKNLAEDFADYQADVQMEIADARAEAITEMEKRLEQIGTPLMHTYVVTRMDIRQVVEDMKEET